MGQVYNIPAARPFLHDLAQGILRQVEETNTPLSTFQILLPNRRACRDLRRQFLNISNGKPLLLPQIRPVGEVDVEELSFALAPDLAAELAAIPPAIEGMQRQLLLARLIRQLDDQSETAPRSMEQALLLAQALGQLLDQVMIEERSFDDLHGLVPEEYAEHWQITIEFLKILSENWPEILRERGRIEAADRRNRLLDLLAQHWKDHPPGSPVIVAGSTGTMPATARLINVIRTSAQGQVVLPGLDPDMDDQSWEAMNETHPQKTIRNLLQHFKIDRNQVVPWPVSETPRDPRSYLTGEMMRPADTAEAWTTLSLNKRQHEEMVAALADIELYEADSPEHEAMIIALKLRAALEEPTGTAALVTPDRALAARVKQICRRWQIDLDDSAGEPLAQTAVGVMIRLVGEAALYPDQPSKLLALLQHDLCGCGMAPNDKARALHHLDEELRGPARTIRIEDLPDSGIRNALKVIEDDWYVLQQGGAVSAHDRLHAHLNVLEALAATDEVDGRARVWVGEGGEMAAALFSRLLEQAHTMPSLTGADYAEMLQLFMKGQVVRPQYGTHPRLHILGQIEARLVQYDTMILSGLNEGSWPPDPGADPWMSRPMRANFGLPDPDRAIGQAGHDFVQAFAAKKVVLTRAQQQEGAPSVPARWLQRLDTVLRALEIDTKIIRGGIFANYAAQIDQPDGLTMSVAQPAPTPPVAARPTTLSVTAIEAWMRDPYHIYARYILELNPLDPLEQDADAALRGQWLHDLLSWYVETFKTHVPPDAYEQLLDKARNDPQQPGGIELWWPRFERMAQWFVEQDRDWRDGGARNVITEGKGVLPLGDYSLTAKADRIDLTAHGHGAVIDYKTGTVPNMKEVKLGLSPQLTLEGLILAEGGFEQVKACDSEILHYWKLSGGREAGEVKSAIAQNDSADVQIRAAKEGILQLFTTFQNPDIPYISLPDPSVAPAYQDYAHLARAREWEAGEDSESEAA